MDIAEARQRAADRAFEQYDFGELTVSGVGSWYHIDPNDELSWVFFLDGDDIDQEPTTRQVFIVRFRPHTAVATEAFVRGWQTACLTLSQFGPR